MMESELSGLTVMVTPPPLPTEEGERLLFSAANKLALGRSRNVSEFIRPFGT